MSRPALKRFVIPARYGFGVEVPKGGSSCASCFYVGGDGASCNNAIFRRVEGTSELGKPASEFCCPLWTRENVGDLVPEAERK
jgi:hypothetical protein